MDLHNGLDIEAQYNLCYTVIEVYDLRPADLHYYYYYYYYYCMLLLTRAKNRTSIDFLKTDKDSSLGIFVERY